ncbi:DUF5074 domain-containing protein [Mucilaginibacter sp. SP1R1]|uniref:DUF5074 domain-containing protein n=1 Tax=Mucilaginibacter sp. SP1R1 TaxID=2723091 RepID=UPI0016098D5A|nr:DUF5074 domain-containing protein [Mucilaginibacter sp. SP1R1]MBB6149889.1 hypothetical protein [Mucilaginibacter sp. SP1R1]
MKKSALKLLPCIFPVLLLVSSCKKDIINKAQGVNSVTDKALTIRSVGKYDNGFFLINEGWYAHGTGTVSFYDYGTGTITDSVFTKENPGLNLNPTSSTLQYGTIFNDKLFLVSKVGGPFVIVNSHTLKEINRIAAKSTNDFRAFVGIDTTKGLISTGSGIYPVNLQTLALGTKISGVTGQVGDMIKAGNYVFVLSQSSGVIVLNASTNAVVKTITGMLCAFARSMDGAIWAAGGTQLIRIDPATLVVQTITVPFQIYGSWSAWHPGSITASTTENAIFIARNATSSGGTQVYKYTAANSASFTTPFITVPTGRELYGAGVAYAPAHNQVIVNTVHSGFTTNFSFNDLVFYNASSGAQINDIAYTGYYFPSVAVFH